MAGPAAWLPHFAVVAGASPGWFWRKRTSRYGLGRTAMFWAAPTGEGTPCAGPATVVAGSGATPMSSSGATSASSAAARAGALARRPARVWESPRTCAPRLAARCVCTPELRSPRENRRGAAVSPASLSLPEPFPLPLEAACSLADKDRAGVVDRIRRCPGGTIGSTSTRKAFAMPARILKFRLGASLKSNSFLIFSSIRAPGTVKST